MKKFTKITIGTLAVGAVAGIVAKTVKIKKDAKFKAAEESLDFSDREVEAIENQMRHCASINDDCDCECVCCSEKDCKCDGKCDCNCDCCYDTKHFKPVEECPTTNIKYENGQFAYPDGKPMTKEDFDKLLKFQRGCIAVEVATEGNKEEFKNAMSAILGEFISRDLTDEGEIETDETGENVYNDESAEDTENLENTDKGDKSDEGEKEE